MTPSPRLVGISTNLAAFLNMLAVSEGTAGHGDDGYNLIVGGELFHSYADHPRTMVKLPRLGINSSAAGRYQVLKRTFDAYKVRLRLTDFSPVSQDQIAVRLIREQGALPDIEAGRIPAAIAKCANIWASLPGAGYGQHEHKLENLLAAYRQAGGNLAGAAA